MHAAQQCALRGFLLLLVLWRCIRSLLGLSLGKPYTEDEQAVASESCREAIARRLLIRQTEPHSRVEAFRAL